MNALLVAKSLVKQGHECEIWFLIKSGELDTEGIKTRVFCEKTPKGIKEWLALCKQYFCAINEYKADAIISFYPLSNILGSLSKLSGGTKRFVATQRNPVQKQSKPIFWLEMLFGSTPLYDSNIAVSQFVVNSCKKYPSFYKKKLRVVYNGVPPLPTIQKKQSECRELLGLTQDCFLIGSLGRLDLQKNVSILIEMMQFLPKTHLAIAGTGHLEDELKQLSKDLNVDDRITFLGNLQNEKVTMFYRAIDVFAFATHFEGFGRTLIESFSMETPVIASSLDVLKEVGGDAAIYVPNTAEAWSEAVDTLCEDKELRQTLSMKGKQRINQFDLDLMLNRYSEILFNRKPTL